MQCKFGSSVDIIISYFKIKEFSFLSKSLHPHPENLRHNNAVQIILEEEWQAIYTLYAKKLERLIKQIDR